MAGPAGRGPPRHRALRPAAYAARQHPGSLRPRHTCSHPDLTSDPATPAILYIGPQRRSPRASRRPATCTDSDHRGRNSWHDTFASLTGTTRPRSDGLLHAFNEEFGEPTPGPSALAERMRRLLDDGGTLVLLAGDGPDGLAVLCLRAAIWSAGLECYLAELYVTPARRGQGLGRALMEAAIGEARDRARTPWTSASMSLTCPPAACTRASASATGKAATVPSCTSTNGILGTPPGNWNRCSALPLRSGGTGSASRTRAPLAVIRWEAAGQR
jgi:GNAT superfamily N-acetyltransferase